MKSLSRISGIWLLIVFIISLLALPACSQESTPSTNSPQKTTVTPSPSSTASAPSGPFLQITSPEKSATSGIGSITIVIKVDNFKLTGDFGAANISGQGHIHYYMDVEPPMTANQPAITAAGKFAESSSTSFVWKNVGSGDHQYSVQLVNNDHTPLNPPVIARVAVKVTAGAGMPALVIVSPREGEVIEGNSVTIKAEVVNFNIVDKIGQSKAANEGHLMFYQDVEAPTIQGPQATSKPGSYKSVAGTSCTWQDLTPGTHNFSVQLANNDNTPLNPPISAKITLSVK